MRSLLTNAVGLLNTALQITAGETVAYRRGNDSIDGLSAVPVRIAIEDYSVEQEVSLTTLDRDWIIWAEDLVIGGKRILPQTGDYLDWVDPLNVKRTYRIVVRNADGGRCYRYTDQSMQQIRVFSVEIRGNAE